MMKLLSVVISFALCGAALADAPTKASTRIEIAVTKRGFEPDSITVPARTPLVLVFTRKTDETCTKRVVVTLDDGNKLERDLPLDKPVELAVTFARPGKLSYACAMDMVTGVIVVQ